MVMQIIYLDDYDPDCKHCTKLEQNFETESQNCRHMFSLADETWNSVALSKEQMADKNIGPIFKLKQEKSTRPDIKEIVTCLLLWKDIGLFGFLSYRQWRAQVVKNWKVWWQRYIYIWLCQRRVF